MNHEHSQTDKTVRLKWLGEPEGHGGEVTQRFCCFCIKRGKLEGMGDFSPGETCEPFVVRGTTSFYNKKLQFFPVGEGAVWNVRM